METNFGEWSWLRAQGKSWAIVRVAISWDEIKNVVANYAAHHVRHRGARFEWVCITN